MVMNDVLRNQEMMVPENLRQHLAVAVRSIHWSYAIFWSLSATKEGTELKWVDGYYSGDVMTRKTVQSTEFKVDKIGLQRSEQLRELFLCLHEGQGDLDQEARPHAALSPEDLSDAEWYYVVCMSFTLDPGEGFPGRALATGQTIWLCNAERADNKVFSRSLLAKSASIKTVVCFPHLNGVVELGTTELVMEDPCVIRRIKTSLLDFSKPVCSDTSSSAPHSPDDDQEPMCAKTEHELVDELALENQYAPAEDIEHDHENNEKSPSDMLEEFNMDSPDNCSNDFEDSFILEGLSEGHSHDDSFGDSISSSDCVSEAIMNLQKTLPLRGEGASHLQVKDIQSKLSKFSSSAAADDLHYRRTLSLILRSSNMLNGNPCFLSHNYKSSFVAWKKGALDNQRPEVQQNMLKKILLSVPLMYGSRSIRCHTKRVQDCIMGSGSYDISGRHVLSDERKENEDFLVLRSMVPSISKTDKAAILKDTIKYLKDLEARVEHLESCMASVDHEAKLGRNLPDILDQTSDNYEHEEIYAKKPRINKRKAADMEETDPELNKGVAKDDLSPHVKVSKKEKEVLVEMTCHYREDILLDIMDKINGFHLDAHTVQSSTLNGFLTLTLVSKVRGADATPVGIIKQELWKIVKCHSSIHFPIDFIFYYL